MPADIAVGAQGQSAATTDQKTPASPTASQALLNQPLKLDLAAALAGKKLLVVAASIEQRPSRRILDMLAAQADAIAKQGYAIVLVHPAVTDEKQVRQWLADHKLDVAQVILAKDQADVARLMTACGAESLPFMLLTDDKHVVTVLDIQPDKLGTLGETPPASQQPTTSPAKDEVFRALRKFDRTILTNMTITANVLWSRHPRDPDPFRVSQKVRITSDQGVWAVELRTEDLAQMPKYLPPIRDGSRRSEFRTNREKPTFSPVW